MTSSQTHFELSALCFGQHITGTASRGDGATFNFRLYLNGACLGKSGYVQPPIQWAAYLIADFQDAAGQMHVVQFQAKQGWVTTEWRLVCDDQVLV